MSLLERIRAGLHVMTAPHMKTAGSQAAWNYIFTTGLDKLMPGVMNMPFAQHPTVHAAVEAISTSIAALPLEMFPEDDMKREEPIRDSIVGDLLETPGPDMDGPQLIEGTIDFMKLEGEAFWFMDGFARREPKGPKFPTRLDLWRPVNVRHVTNDAGRLVAWEYQDGTDTFRTSTENVIQFKHFNPYDPIRGLAPMQAARLAVEGGYKALQYQDAFFANNAMPTGLMMPKEGAIVQPEAMVRLRDEFEARHMGAGKHGRLGATSAPIDFKEIGLSQKDMDYATWLDSASALILMVFKVPPAVAGLQKDANYNESVHQSKRFWYNHLPLVKYLERRIKARLCRQFGIAETPYFKTEMIKALTEDQESLSNQARNYWNMGVKFRDINDRLELGFPADSVCEDTNWIPFSLVNGDEQAEAPARAETGGPDREPRQGEEQNQPGDESTVANDPTMGKAVSAPSGREFQRTLSWRTLISKVRDEERAFSWRVAQHFAALKKEVLLNLRTRKATPLTVNVETVMFDERRAADDLKERLTPLYKSAIQKGAETVIRELQIRIDFSFLSPEVSKFLSEKMFEIAGLVDGPLADDLRLALDEGIAAGESVDKIADRVEEVFSVGRSRAERIARTEVAESFNGGRYATMKEAGVGKIEWLSARDSRVRDSHQDVDGEVIVLGDRFSNGLLYPTDPAGPAEEVVNCRCVSVPVA